MITDLDQLDVPDAAKDVLVAVGRACDVCWQLYCGDGQIAILTEARAIAAILLRERTDLSLEQIGRLLGGRTRSTVHELIDRYQHDPDARKRLASARGLCSEIAEVQN